jgi:hypothetical protein
MNSGRCVEPTAASPLSRLRRRVGVGVLPQDALFELIGCPPPAALRASTSPASGRGEADRRQNRFNQKPSRFRNPACRPISAATAATLLHRCPVAVPSTAQPAQPGAALRPAGGGAIQNMLFAPFRPRSAHVMIFRPVSFGRPVPGWAQKSHQSADGAAQKRNKNRCSARVLSLRPAETILTHRLASDRATRPIIMVGDQIAIFFMAGKKVNHLRSPRSAPMASEWAEDADNDIGNRDGVLLCVISPV